MKTGYYVLTAVAISTLILVGSCGRPAPARLSGVEGTIGKKCMVVTAHPLATEIGLQVLREGGNAFDAAVAVYYALAVVYPQAGNIGGGGYMVYRRYTGEVGALDFRETAPAAASRDMYLDAEGNVISNKSKLGHLACGVPGSVAGIEEMYWKLASKPFAPLLEPAIRLAREGFVLTENGAGAINWNTEAMKTVNTVPTCLVKNEPWKSGDTVRFTELASTLERIRDRGKWGFYAGKTAELIVEEMKRGGGIITYDDLMNYKPVYREPIKVRYKNYDVYSMPPSSSGGIALGQLIEGSTLFDFSKMKHNGAEHIHTMTELMRRVYADRATYLGDPAFYAVPKSMLLDPLYIKERMSNIHSDHATPSGEIKEGKVDRIESFQTTHFSITDQWGNAVSITTTLNGYFGNEVMVGGAGFFLNNEMDDFSAKPGIPNQFGLVGGEANAIAPGKRMLSSMTPTIVEKDGDLFMVLGTPGGSTIITNVYQVFLNATEYGMTMQEAVNAKKIHAQWLPDIITLEEGAADEATIKQLENMGHHIDVIPQIGKFEAIMVRPDGSYEGAADISRPGDCTARGE